MNELVVGELALVTLAALPGMTPARLQALVRRWPDPALALAAVQAGRATEAFAPRHRAEVTELATEWRTANPDAIRALLRKRRARAFVAGTAEYPIRDEIPNRPLVLFGEGDGMAALDRPRVAVVGTRAASPHGLADAFALGEFLAAHGVTVVSGMAIGIDGAVHEGALAAGAREPCVVGVVATGLDIEYPRRHMTLHRRVRERGVLLSENPYGTAPSAGRFPVRNRIIAALADVVVVVEATAKGGARITAEQAIDYDRPVLAVPGSRRNEAATGCNELIRDGAMPLLDPSDVLVALGMTPGVRRGWVEMPSSSSAEPTGPITPDALAVLRVLSGEPAGPDELAARTRFDAVRVSLAVESLRRAGRVACDRGFVWPL
jgi:DNA processing protein